MAGNGKECEGEAEEKINCGRGGLGKRREQREMEDRTTVRSGRSQRKTEGWDRKKCMEDEKRRTTAGWKAEGRRTGE